MRAVARRSRIHGDAASHSVDVRLACACQITRTEKRAVRLDGALWPSTGGRVLAGAVESLALASAPGVMRLMRTDVDLWR
jgi:hypothetical protein